MTAQQDSGTTRATVRWMLVLVGAVAVLWAFSKVAERRGCNKIGAYEPDPCDLERRLFNTAGSRSVEIRDRVIPGARLFRFHRNSVPAYSSAVGCRPSGELLQPDEVFELLPHGSGSAEELANLHAWCFHEGGLGKVEVVLTEDRFVAFGVARGVFTPPTIRLGVVSFWRADTYESWGPAPQLRLYVVDSLIGLGGTAPSIEPPWFADRASLPFMLSEARNRDYAFPRLAFRPRRDLAKELLDAIPEEKDAELRYLGLMGLRGEAGIEQVERLGALAESETSPLVRMGIVQTLATIPDPKARQLATAILQRESDARARRVMQAVLKY